MHRAQGICCFAACVSIFAATARGAAQEENAAAGEPTGSVTLRQAIGLALERSPDLAVFAWEIRAAEARSVQASRRPNPEAALAIENAGWDLPRFSRSEATLSIGQIIELGGKRGARVRAARADEDVRLREREALAAQVMADVTRRFIEGLAAQNLVRVREESIEIARAIHGSVALKVKAGAVSPAEEARADLELENARLRLEDAERERTLAHVRLSSLWGETDPLFAALSGDLDSLGPLPSRPDLRRRLEESPDAERLRAEVAAADSRFRLARSERIGDLRVDLGYRRLAEEDASTFVGAIAAPLPFFDRNEGSIALAQAERSRAEAEVERARVDRLRLLEEKYSLATRVRSKAEALRAEILPATERTFEAMKAGYERGRFSYVDLLEARRALIEARLDRLSALADYHLIVADLELLIGGALRGDDAAREGLAP